MNNQPNPLDLLHLVLNRQKEIYDFLNELKAGQDEIKAGLKSQNGQNERSRRSNNSTAVTKNTFGPITILQYEEHLSTELSDEKLIFFLRQCFPEFCELRDSFLSVYSREVERRRKQQSNNTADDEEIVNHNDDDFTSFDNLLHAILTPKEKNKNLGILTQPVRENNHIKQPRGMMSNFLDVCWITLNFDCEGNSDRVNNVDDADPNIDRVLTRRGSDNTRAFVEHICRFLFYNLNKISSRNDQEIDLEKVKEGLLL